MNFEGKNLQEKLEERTCILTKLSGVLELTGGDIVINGSEDESDHAIKVFDYYHKVQHIDSELITELLSDKRTVPIQREAELLSIGKQRAKSGRPLIPDFDFRTGFN